MMGGTMLDRRRRDELEGVSNLGRLADKMVFALGRVMRSDDFRPDPADLPVLERARHLFELMTTEDVIVLDQSEDRMLNNDSYLDALHAVQLRAGPEVAEYAQRYVDLLQNVINGTISEEQRADLDALQELFAEVGEITMSRASELSRPRQEPSWRRMRQAISRF
jgi:hypothetical protein